MPGHWYKNTDPKIAEKLSNNAEANTVTRVYLDENHKCEQDGKSPVVFWDNLLRKEI